MKATPKGKGRIPGAHPTAPGGMSQTALVAELVERHGYTKADATRMKWPEQIEAVCQARLDREREAKAAQPEPTVDEPVCEVCGDETDNRVNGTIMCELCELEEGIEDSDVGPEEPTAAEQIVNEGGLLAALTDDEDDDDEDWDSYLLEPDENAPIPVEEIADEAEAIIEDVQAVLAKHEGESVGAVEEALHDAGLDHEPTMADYMRGKASEATNTQDREAFKAEVEQGIAEADLDPEEMFAQMREAREAEQAENPPLFIGLPVVKDYIFDGHMGAGPSGAERWMNCTGSLEATRKFLETLTPNQQAQFAGANMAARQGTTAHAAAEVMVGVMMGTLSPEEAENTLLELTLEPDAADEAYDSEMAEHVAGYVDLVKQYVDAGHEVLVEQRVEAAVPLTAMLSDGDDVYVIRGSGDFVALPTEAEPVLTVGDLKYGEGLFVEVDENPQVRIYGLGALALLADEEGNLPDIERIDYHIIQPRMGGIRTWSESVEDLLAWRDDVLSPALTQALLGAKGGATLVPGEQQCQWCPVRGSCPALAEQRIEAAAELFDVIVDSEMEGETFPETESLSNERLATLLAQITALIDIKDDLKAEAQRRLHRGEHVPGFKMVSYTPPRKWAEGADSALDPEHGEVALSADEARALWKHSLVTPTQALKVLGERGKAIEDLIEVPDKRPVIAPEGDRRKTWEGRPPEQLFPDDE